MLSQQLQYLEEEAEGRKKFQYMEGYLFEVGLLAQVEKKLKFLEVGHIMAIFYIWSASVMV